MTALVLIRAVDLHYVVFTMLVAFFVPTTQTSELQQLVGSWRALASHGLSAPSGQRLYVLSVSNKNQRHERLHVAAFAPDESNEANRTVRKHGTMLVAFALGAFFVGEGWAIGGVIPVRWFAVAAVILGAGLLALPLQYRRLHRKGWLGKKN